VIDILFANKDENGKVEMVEVNDLDDDDFRHFDPVVTDVTDMLNEEDVRMFASAAQPNSSAALLLFENTWATRFRDALVNLNAGSALRTHSEGGDRRADRPGGHDGSAVARMSGILATRRKMP
jgi:hypothetical protein